MHQSPALRDLAEHPDLPFSRMTLWRSIRLIEQHEVLGEELSRQLTLSQHRNLFGLRYTLRVRLAKRVVRERLTVEQLKALVARPRGGVGRPRIPPLLRQLRALSTRLGAVGRLEASIPGLTGCQANEAVLHLDSIIQQATDVREQIVAGSFPDGNSPIGHG